MSKVLAKTVQLYAGLDLIGSKQSVSHKSAELEVTPIGVKMTSKGTGRVVLLPWSNVKGVELIVEDMPIVQERVKRAYNRATG